MLKFKNKSLGKKFHCSFVKKKITPHLKTKNISLSCTFPCCNLGQTHSLLNSLLAKIAKLSLFVNMGKRGSSLNCHVQIAMYTCGQERFIAELPCTCDYLNSGIFCCSLLNCSGTTALILVAWGKKCSHFQNSCLVNV